MSSDNGNGSNVSERIIDGLTVRDVGGVPCVLATDLAVRLEFSVPVNIHKLAKRLRKQEKLNENDLFSTVETRVDALGITQTFEQLWLTETGAVIVAISSRTKVANQICRWVVNVFIEARHRRVSVAPGVDIGIVLAALTDVRGELRAMRIELAAAHAKAWDANAAAFAAMLNADRELWKEMKAGRDAVNATFAGYDSLARRLGWHEENVAIDGVITAKQHIELRGAVKRIADIEVLSGRWKNYRAAMRDIDRDLGETVRWGGNEQPWRMLPAQRIGDARTCLARRHKTALATLPADKRAEASQGDLFGPAVRPEKVTKH